MGELNRKEFDELVKEGYIVFESEKEEIE